MLAAAWGVGRHSYRGGGGRGGLLNGRKRCHPHGSALSCPPLSYAQVGGCLLCWCGWVGREEREGAEKGGGRESKTMERGELVFCEK